MEKIVARSLLQYSTSDLWTLMEHKPRFLLVFDDNTELESTWKELVYSSYFWDFFRKYPNTPMLKKHHLRTVLNGKRYNAKTHRKLMANVMWDVYDTYKPNISRDVLARETYEKINEIYNDLTIRLEAYVVDLDILDFINALDHPAIMEANNTVEPTPEGIEKNHEIIKKTIANDPALQSNQLAKMANSNVVNMGQLIQCVGVRGYLTDTDSSRFNTPILRGYVEGIRLFHDSLIESRSAAKSLVFSKKPLEDAEYFSRRLQLMDQIVWRLHEGDCGSTNYQLWHVQGPAYNEQGKVVFSGDLERLEGKFYLDEESNTLKVVRMSDTHLIGKALKLRVVAECAHEDPYGICSTCFGELSLSVPPNTNIGHMCCTQLTEKSSQSVLSVKHEDASARIEPIYIASGDRKYLSATNDGNSYLLEKGLKGLVKIIIDAKEAQNITDITEVKRVEDLNITSVSAMTEIGIEVTTGRGYDLITIPVGKERRPASLSYAMLNYIRKKGFQADTRGNYVVDMSDWDRSKPIMSLPLRDYNMSDHSRDIAALLESTVKDLKKRDKIITPNALLVDLYKLVNSKLSVNLAILEVVLYGLNIVSAENYDYRLPKPWTTRGVGVKKTIMAYRSLSATMAFEDHREILTNPLSYLLKNRPDHPFDYILAPREVEAAYANAKYRS